ncbi:MAG: hypothetical protein ABJA84_09550 [Polaromonas sp.]
MAGEQPYSWVKITFAVLAVLLILVAVAMNQGAAQVMPTACEWPCGQVLG